MNKENQSDDLFSNLKDGFSEFGKKVGSFMDDVLSSDFTGNELKIRTDVYQTRNQFVVELELPGVNKENVSIQIYDGSLNVRGEKHAPDGNENVGFIKRERKFGNFICSFPLPVSAKVDEVKAKYESGVLIIRIPLAVVEKEDDSSSINID